MKYLVLFLLPSVVIAINSPVTAMKHLYERVWVDGHNPLPKQADYVPHNFLSIANKTACELTITTKQVQIIIPPFSGYITKKEDELCDVKK